MLKKVLIANRGEIALRVIRACRDLGIACVAVHSEADRQSRFVHEADEAIEIGPASASKSYLAIDRIVDAAVKSGADSVHPGYGFLSENSQFAAAVVEAGLIFIGPPASVIESLGSKLETRRIMEKARVPVLPGTDALEDMEGVEELAAEIGYPLLVKPSGGGGGRGMRVVQKPEELLPALMSARRESARSFVDSHVYLEKLLSAGRHVEVQIVADAQGDVIHVGSRDCSTQRRHQKLVEEAPAPALTPAQQKRVCSLAVQAAKAAGYVGAGTVEFLYDGAEFYILEVNTRIQVEHCVSEMVSGIDLVAEQLRIAGGEPLSVSQKDVVLRGHAIECRVYAEDPRRNFLPSTGRVEAALFPAGPWVREDRGFEAGDEITSFYDGMLAKLVVWGDNRDVAIARMLRALREYRIEGIETNLEFLRWLVDGRAFRDCTFDTGFVEREFRPEFLPARSGKAARAATARGRAPAVESAEGGEESARAARVATYFYRCSSHDIEQDYLIEVVSRSNGHEAIPLSPANRQWAAEKFRRTAATAAAAIDLLVEQVLDEKHPTEIFPDLSVTF
jgi:acetyl-CoA carboxylase biotin carboxylase subunit